MSDLRVPNRDDDIARMRKDVDDLLRRAPQFDTPDAPPSCCGTYCCPDTDGHTITTGGIATTCEFEPDPVGGVGVRISYTGWARVIYGSSGSSAMVWWAEVDATKHDGAPREDRTVATNDVHTIPLGGTIDVDVPDPFIAIRVQNLSTVSIQVVQVYVELRIMPREGDSHCGHAHVGTGPL